MLPTFNSVNDMNVCESALQVADVYKCFVDQLFMTVIIRDVAFFFLITFLGASMTSATMLIYTTDKAA